MTIIDPNDSLPPAYDGQGLASSQNLQLRLTAQPSTSELLISLIPPSAPAPQGEKQESKRPSVDLCLVLDVSGSMSARAPAPDEKENEATGLSVLDVVKHATRTIMESLDDDDRVSIVVFSSNAEIITPLTSMTQENKTESWNKVSKLGTRGNTNLWDGLKTGLNVLTAREGTPTGSTEQAEAAPRLHALFLLTDGQPNVEPPRGHLPSLERYLDAIPAGTPRPSIHTFGFGYGLDSQLLDALAHRGGGGYGFMPDSGMVGTVFVHAVANVVCTWAATCEVNIEVEPEAENSVEVLGAFSAVNASWGAQIQVGDILYGQSRDLVVRLPQSCFGPGATSKATVTVRYRPHSLSATAEPLVATGSVNPNIETEGSVDLRHAVFRLSFVHAIKQLFVSPQRRSVLPPATKTTCTSSLEQMQTDPALVAHAPAVALRADIASQVLLALENEHWPRWGTHYLPSLSRAHLRQQCSNFKDPGLQVYGTDSALFRAVRDALSEKFESLPAPKPSLSHRPEARVTNMARWHSSSAPCFAGSCKIALGDGSASRVDQLRAGMQVGTPNGPRAVVSVLRTACPRGVVDLVSLDGLLVTPWHPVVHKGEWVFPASIAAPSLQHCDAVYSVLLEHDTDPASHAVNVGGVWCVTLGHGSIEGVRKHEFLGNWNAVRRAMLELSEYEGQKGVMAGGGVARDAETGLICGFVRGDYIGGKPEKEMWQELTKMPAAIAVC